MSNGAASSSLATTALPQSCRSSPSTLTLSPHPKPSPKALALTLTLTLALTLALVQRAARSRHIWKGYVAWATARRVRIAEEELRARLAAEEKAQAEAAEAKRLRQQEELREKT